MQEIGKNVLAKRRARCPAFEWQRALHISFAEGKGFEPLVRGYRTLVFKTSSIGRSDNLPH